VICECIYANEGNGIPKNYRGKNKSVVAYTHGPKPNFWMAQ